MKKQTNPDIKAYLIRSAFYVLLLLAVCVIPFALGQRNSNKRGGHAALAASAPTQNVAPVASNELKAATGPSSVRFSWETQQHFGKKLPPGRPIVTAQTGARAIRVPLKPTRPAGVACTWSIVANYPFILESPSVCSDGTFAYAAGGFDGTNFVPTDAFNRYDPLLDTWTPLANLPNAIYDARSVYAANTNSIYVFGGIDIDGFVTNLVQIYDVAADTWSTGTPMPAERFFPATVYYDPNGKIYVAGGIDGTFSETSTTWEYDPVTDTWNTSRAPIPVAMGGSAVSLVGQNMYLQGSFGSGATNLNYRYDIVADAWTQMASMPFPRYEAAGGAIGTKTYVVGGGNPFLGPQASAEDRKLAAMRAPDFTFSTTFIYDTTTDTWFTGPQTNVGHSFTGGTALGDLMLVVGGFDGFTGDTDIVEKGELLACTLPVCPPTPTPLSGLVVADGLTVGFGPSGYQQIARNIVNYTFCKSVSAPNEFALFETHDPWGATVVKDAITGAGHTYTEFTPDQLAGFDFSQYRVVILNWDDTLLSDFDSQYEAAIPALEAYAAAGGVVWVQGASQFIPGQNNCYSLPFGGQSCVDFSFSDPIIDPSNPMVLDVCRNPITGNAASHVADTCLPVAAHVVVVNGTDNNPVLYELGPGGAACLPTPTPPACSTGLIHNSGFETGNFSNWVDVSNGSVPVVTNAIAHTGRFSAFMGGDPPGLAFCGFGNEIPGDSSIYQEFGPVPAGATLSFWHWDCTTDSITFDWQDAYITDTSGNILLPIYHQCSNQGCWIHETVDLSPWVGQTIRIQFLVHQDNFGDLTSMAVDDVQVTLPGPCAPTPTPRARPTPRGRPTPPPR
jgi:N-acetylneuraminic acid mutarotase